MTSDEDSPKHNRTRQFLDLPGIPVEGLVAMIRASSINLEWEQFIHQALDIIADHCACDLVEINLLDEGVGHLIPHRWSNAKSRSYVKKRAPQRYPLGKGYTGWLVENRSPLLIPDTAIDIEIQPVSGQKDFPFKSYLGVPLLLEHEQRLLGTIEIAHQDAGKFSERTRDLLVLFASQLALKLQSMELQNKINQHALRQDMLKAMSLIVHQYDDLESLVGGASRVLLDHMDVSLLGIFSRSENDHELRTPALFLKLSNGWTQSPAELTVLPETDLVAIWHHQEYWLSNHVNTNTLESMGLDLLLQNAPITKILITPLIVGGSRQGLVIAGRMELQADFHDGDAETLQSFGRQLGSLYSPLAKQTSQPPSLRQAAGIDFQVAEARISPERMTELVRLSAELTTNLDLDQSLRRVLGLCNQLMEADLAAFITQDSPGEPFTLRQVVPENGANASRTDSIRATAQSISDWIDRHRRTLVIDDLTQDERWALQGHHSLCAVPCLTGDQLTGVILFFAVRKSAFGSDEQQIAQVVGRQMASALNNTYLYGVIREQADRLGLMLRSQQIETSQSNAILESIADGVIVTDADHHVILYNQAAEKILNLPTIQVLGKAVFDFIGIFGEEAARWGEIIRQWRSNPPSKLAQPSMPERMILDDGRVISMRPAPVVLGDDFLGTVSIFRDITREVEVDRLKSEFVATVSHELRTPMTSIKGFVDLMLMGAAGEINEEQRHFLDIVRTNTTRLEILVNDLLDISRIEAGKATLIFQELDVYQLMSEMEQYIEHRCQEEGKQMNFSHKALTDLPSIWGDLERVRQILANIVENSFDYTPEGGSIEMRARQVNNHVEIEVQDNGMGIALDEQERIFERFYRGEQALIMGVSGTGLGLAIVLNLVEMHHGRIWVTSEGIPGKGTIFTVSLPSTPPETN